MTRALFLLAGLALAGCLDPEDPNGVVVVFGDGGRDAAGVGGDGQPRGGDAGVPGRDGAPKPGADGGPRRDGGPGDASPRRDGQPPRDAAPRPDQMLPGPPRVRLQIHPMDIWAQPLRDYRLEVEDPAGRPLANADRGVSLERGRHLVTLAAPDHHEIRVSIDAPANDDAEAVTLDRSDAPDGVSVLRGDGRIDLYLGLRHRWFAATGRPARAGNRVELLLDGEQAWERVHGRIQAARASIHSATWWWESDFELIRPEQPLDPAQRRRNTMMSLLEASPARKRVMVFQNAIVERFNVDDPLREHGRRDDDFEFMGQANPTVGRFVWEIPQFVFADRVASARRLDRQDFDRESPIRSPIERRNVDLELTPLDFEPELGSYHQKFFVIDGTEAFVGGMNVKAADWDTSAHRVYEPRRMSFESDAEARREVAAKERDSDQGPRKDYMTYLQGPIVQDVQETFAARWRFLIEEAAPNSSRASFVDVERDHQTWRDGVDAQLVNTMPAPFREYSIFESHYNAIMSAERYILIEDQYWRAPMLVDAILSRMAARPDLRLVVITKPVAELGDPGCYWMYLTHGWLQREFGDRYALYQLRAFDYRETWGIDETEGVFADMDVHSKIMVVDDLFVSVGSCNKNNRGYTYEGEMNVNVVDPVWAAEARRRIVGGYLGVSPAQVPGDWMGRLEQIALANESTYDLWDQEGFDISLDGDPLPAIYRPQGLIYPLELGPAADCLIEGIGPDIARPVP